LAVYIRLEPKPNEIVFAGMPQSTWNFHNLRLLVPKFRKKLGVPGGGGLAGPSRSDGSRPPKLALNWKHCCVAGKSASIEVRSYAHTLEPANVTPLLKILKET
jgi:hypothetical protein